RSLIVARGAGRLNQSATTDIACLSQNLVSLGQEFQNIRDNLAPDDPCNRMGRAPGLGFGNSDCNKFRPNLREQDYPLTLDPPRNSDTKSRSILSACKILSRRSIFAGRNCFAEFQCT